jgi:hypothetical protein
MLHGPAGVVRKSLGTLEIVCDTLRHDKWLTEPSRDSLIL